MATSFDDLVRELRTFRDKKTIINATARGIRQAVAPARKAIKAAAKGTLPHGGGLNVWVSKISIVASIKLTARKAGVKLKGGRNAQGGRADVTKIDNGRVRAPAWGHKTKAAWHNVSVTPGFFTQTAADLPDWRADVDAAVDQSLQELRKG